MSLFMQPALLHVGKGFLKPSMQCLGARVFREAQCRRARVGGGRRRVAWPVVTDCRNRRAAAGVSEAPGGVWCVRNRGGYVHGARELDFDEIVRMKITHAVAAQLFERECALMA